MDRCYWPCLFAVCAIAGQSNPTPVCFVLRLGLREAYICAFRPEPPVGHNKYNLQTSAGRLTSKLALSSKGPRGLRACPKAEPHAPKHGLVNLFWGRSRHSTSFYPQSCCPSRTAQPTRRGSGRTENSVSAKKRRSSARSTRNAHRWTTIAFCRFTRSSWRTGRRRCSR